MNAPAKTPPARDRYIPIVKHHMPACDGAELALRCGILLLRDQATSKLGQCSAQAYGTLAEIQRLASEYAYAHIPQSQLAAVRHHLVQLTMAASGLEMFAYRLETGGADARG